jgi:hypothetical protein
MLPLAVILSTWAAGLLVGRDRQVEQKVSTNKEEASSVEIIKAIRESASQRWEKRRGYEWQLSFSIWTAVAAFGGLALSKDFPVEKTSAVVEIYAVLATLIAGCHAFYFWHMANHPIADVNIQWVCEERLCKEPNEPDLVKELKIYHPSLWKYGWVQVAITVVLLVGVALALMAPTEKPQSQTATAVTSTQAAKQ